MPRVNKILIRSGTVAPTASDFAVGEPAFDKSAGKLYIKNEAGAMVELGTGGTVSSHASTHAADGSDALTAADINALPTAGGTMTGAITHATTQTFVCALGNKDNCGLAPVGDLHTGLFFGADTVNVSTGGTQRMQIDANGNVGIGNNALSNTRLTSAFTLTNATGFGMQCNTNAVASANGAYATFGLQVNVNHNIPAGVANSNVSRAMLVACARNNGFSTDAGSLGFVRGMEFQYGHGNGNAAITPTTTQVIGLQMVPLAGPGTITELYDIYIGTTVYNTGTLGNHFSIFQAQATAKNYFAGNVGIGTTAPTTPLDVSGSTLRLRTARTPSATGAVGEVCWDANYVWICTATNTWRRVTHSPSGAASTTLAQFTARDNHPPATNFATLDTRNSVLVLEFDAATEESATFIGVIPENAVLTNGLTVRLWWMGDTATSGNVRWGVQFEDTGTDLDADSYDTNAQVTSAASGTSGIESVASITITTIDSLAAGDRFRLRVYRVAADATNDTMTGDAQLVAVEVRAA